MVDLVKDTKALFQDDKSIAMQYKEGYMGRAAGFDWAENTMMPAHTRGGSNGAYLVNGATQTGATLTVDTGATAPAAGDVITIAGVYAVNPQNRQAYGSNKLRNFVVTADTTLATGGARSLVVSPAVITAGQFQNVSIPTTSAAAVVTPFNQVGTVSPQNIVMHKTAFCLATADLELPEGVHFAGRASDKQVGLSLRVVRQYTINSDSIPTRVDVLYGWAPLYPELACRVAA
jgi:hypothetical protein